MVIMYAHYGTKLNNFNLPKNFILFVGSRNNFVKIFTFF